MLHYYDLKVSEVFIHENFLINQIREGVHVVPKHTNMLQDILDKHFIQKEVVYISNRINSYSVDPLTYRFVSSIKNLCAIAIVTDNDTASNVAHFEKDFYNKPFRVCETLKDAIAWAHDQLETA